MSIRFARSFIVAGVTSGALVLSLASAATADPRSPSNGVGWKYSESGRGFYTDPVSETPSTPPNPNAKVTWVEYDNPWEFEDENGQVTHGAYCFDVNPDTGVPRTGTGTLRGRPSEPRYEAEVLNVDCIDVPNFVPIEVFTEQLEYEVWREIEEPTIDLRPQPATLVNLPVVVSTEGPDRVEVPINVPTDPEMTGSIVATAEFTWTFEDGGVATGQGRPYTPDVDPRDDGGYYVSEIFREPGVKNVTLDVVWTGYVQVDGLPPEEIEPLEYSVTEQIEVREAGGVLINSYR